MGLKYSTQASSSLQRLLSSPEESKHSLTPTTVALQAGPSSTSEAPHPFSDPQKAKKLFFEFVSRYLSVEVIGMQPGFKQHPDSYLFQGPFGTTMCVPVSIMLEPRETALQIINQKIEEKRKAFGQTETGLSEEGEGSVAWG